MFSGVIVLSLADRGLLYLMLLYEKAGIAAGEYRLPPYIHSYTLPTVCTRSQ